MRRLGAGGIQRFPSDAALVAGVLEGQPDCFDVLYERYFPAVLRFVGRRVHDRAEAEDVTQEVFLQVFLGLAGFEGRSTLRTWILGIAFNQVSRHFRRRRVTLADVYPVDAEALGGSAAGEQAAEDRVDAARAIKVCEHAFHEQLSEHQRQVFWMYYAERLTIDAIADRTGASGSAVKTALCRSRQKLMSPVRNMVHGLAGATG